MSEEISQSFSFRYIFEDEKQHEISAETLLTAELSLLDYIHRFSKKTGIQVGLVYKTREPGSVQDYFDLVWSNPLFQASAAFIIKDVLTAIIKKFISPNPKNKLSDEESTKLNIANYIDLKSKFEAGKLTAEEVNAFLDNDSKLKKYKSIFWKSVKDDSQIKKVEIKRDTNVIQLVQRPDFDSRIIDEKQENEIIHNAKVFITSPVLTKESNEMWSGEYENQLIKFYVKDNDFKNKVFSGEIVFKGATIFIDCELKKIKQFEDNREAKPKYQVDEVNSWGDDPNHTIKIEHSTKKENSNAGQLNLFE
ncbi:hypothetical protein EFT43_07465 [Leuconostoc falkenbergense]|uniref:hypothetical protein n=1 Tax=Leuconostoc falkenbergense TaxID=2766470 RepID=UPI0021A9FC70|nr:hypothetical protein [Leuconostoc falkenbergense]MCT4404736.1 hypothetical protein [Leuconostoc falkenbergense]